MRKRVLWTLGAVGVLCVAALAFFLGKDPISTSATKIQRDFELKAHETLLRSITEHASSPNAFSSDGCSGGLSTAWRAMSKRFPALAEAHQDSPPWEHCCISHDRAYHWAGGNWAGGNWAGGAKDAPESYALRLAADKALRHCVREAGRERIPELAARYGLTVEQIEAMYKVLAETMFDAVRVGGPPCSGLPWRWGYGYPPCSRDTENP